MVTASPWIGAWFSVRPGAQGVVVCSWTDEETRAQREVWPPGPRQGQSRGAWALPPAHSFLSFSKAVETEIFCLLVIVTA